VCLDYGHTGSAVTATRGHSAVFVDVSTLLSGHSTASVVALAFFSDISAFKMYDSAFWCCNSEVSHLLLAYTIKEVYDMEFMQLLANFSVISIILFVVGIGLLIAEMYQPGFGIFGIFGLISLIACIFVTAQTIMQGLMLTGIFFVIILILLTIFILFVSKKLPKRLVLHEEETVEQGFSGTEDMKYLMGKQGIVETLCRPAGSVDFNGVKLDVVSNGEYIEKGTLVEVIEIEGNRIVVKPKIIKEDF